MAEPVFDPEHFFEFDLAQGAVRTRQGERVVLLTEQALSPLVACAIASGRTEGLRELGLQLGHQVRESLGGDPTHLPIEVAAGHAAASLALMGWGRLSLERWGSALLVRIETMPAVGDGRQAMSLILEGMLCAVSMSDIACVPVDSNGGFLVLHPSIGAEVTALVQRGESLGSIVGRLEAP